MLIRPSGIVRQGRLERGLELVIEDGVVTEIRPLSGVADPFIVSPAFVNAHSHLEYRAMQGVIEADEYWSWIREITERKKGESAAAVVVSCELAARENVAVGVHWIGEHSDRPGSAAAMAAVGLTGAIFQEVITFFERESREEKLAGIRLKAAEAAGLGIPVYLAPHAFQTVDAETLREIGESGVPCSIHVAETPYESQLSVDGSGPIGDFYRRFGFETPVTGLSVVASLAQLGLARPGSQFVHCCAVGDAEIELIARSGVTVAHCPRSNETLKCPIAPVRRMLEAGVSVGLGLDSAASSGPIDMFAEMRSALVSSRELGEPLTAEQVWNMATEMGFESVPGMNPCDHSIFVGSNSPLLAIDCAVGSSLDEIISMASPAQVRRLGA